MPKNIIELNKEATMQKWSERIKSCRSSNLKVSEWCQKNNIAYSTYYAWQKKLFQTAVTKLKNDQPKFAEITVSTEMVAMQTKTVTQAPEIIATLERNGIIAKLYSNASTEVISAICKGLK